MIPPASVLAKTYHGRIQWAITANMKKLMVQAGINMDH
jgi:hypothetical protein